MKRSKVSEKSFRKKFDGAGGETRTLMSVTSPDFESGAYTNFATPARIVGADAILVEAARSGQPLARLTSFQSKSRNNSSNSGQNQR